MKLIIIIIIIIIIDLYSAQHKSLWALYMYKCERRKDGKEHRENEM